MRAPIIIIKKTLKSMYFKMLSPTLERNAKVCTSLDLIIEPVFG